MQKEHKIINGDSLVVLKDFADNSIDAIVTDAPYGLSFMGKKWDYDVPSVEIWQECLRVLKPGGYLLAFAGTRTQHRMAVRIEDAGFEIRDMIAWVYGQGFPKSLDIGKAVDKRGGTTSEQSLEFAKYIKERRHELKITLTEADWWVCAGSTNYSWYEGRPAGQRLPRKSDYLKMKELLKLDDRYDSFMEETEREFLGNYDTDMGGLGGERLGDKGGKITKGTSEWEGWGTALKPALEPITVARKPIEGTVAENCLKWGVGGINIDGSRVGFEKIVINGGGGGEGTGWGKKEEINEERTGRFPANLIHDGSEEVLELFPNESHRFFYTPKASKSERNMGLDGFEEKNINERKEGGKSLIEVSGAKAANFHPTVKPIKLMEYLVNLVSKEGHTVLDPFCGSGTTGIACKKLNRNFIGIERDEEYCKIAEARINNLTLN